MGVATIVDGCIARRSGNQSDRSETTRIAVFFGAHAPLAMLVYHFPAIAALHALVVFGIGIWAALRWRPEQVASVGAYIVGAEVLWRMAGAPIPWEFGKYALVAIFFITITRLGRSARWRVLPLLYFAALLPSIAIILNDPGVTFPRAVNMVSFNLSGPLSLFASAWFLSQLRFTSTDTRRLLAALIAPTLGIAVVTLVTTYTAAHLSFTDESNFVTSGGFGPNQVSVVLGLGALAALFYAIDRDADPGSRWVAFGAILVLGMQSAMTFSRGGLYSAGGGALAATWYLMRDRAIRRRLVIIAVGMLVLSSAVILPRLNAVTHGELGARFSDTNPSHRGDIIRADIRIWSHHLAFGTGPGGAKEDRHTESTVAHTEYTRMLAEHGLFGVFALAMLALMCLKRLWRQHSSSNALSAGLFAWSLLSMVHVGMRVAALGFTFGLAQAAFSCAPADKGASRAPYLPARGESEAASL